MTIWTDVIFDVSTGEQAATELREAAAELDRLGDRRAELANDVRIGWSGVQRDVFDHALVVLQDAVAHLAGDLLAAADQIDADVADAAAEQRRRVEAREDWRREREAERVAQEMR